MPGSGTVPSFLPGDSWLFQEACGQRSLSHPGEITIDDRWKYLPHVIPIKYILDGSRKARKMN